MPYFSSMGTLYNLLTHVAGAHLQVAQGFNKKLKTFVQGRKRSFQILEEAIGSGDQSIWFHCASLGEFEQAVPIMEEVRKKYAQYKIVLTFFSPSGYEVKKDTTLADAVLYLPLDTPSNARRFIELAKPRLAIFVKYEFWPNYLFELKKKDVPVLLVSGVFRKNQIFFKPHGGFMRKALRTIDHFFVQNKASEELLKSLKINNSTVSGDTRFDRVSHQIEMDNTLDFMEDFKGDSLCVVCGSTWPEDEILLEGFINKHPEIKIVLAPHKIDPEKIEALQSLLKTKTVLYSEKNKTALNDASVLIIDAIGLLSKIYYYADIAYVGGAVGKTGLHNILEPATFGVPIVIGNNYSKFPEAVKLEQLAGLFAVANSEECDRILTRLVENQHLRNKTGMICGHYVNSNTGATAIILDYLDKLNRNGLI